MENGLINESKIPAVAIKMVRVWTNMKRGRKHHYQDTIAGQRISLLDQVPASNSEAICSDGVAKRIETDGEQLVIDGYVVVYPIGLTNEWSYKRTVAGDQLLRVSQYS
jgi:hypothetical protein